MPPALIASLLRTMGIDPAVLLQHVENIGRLAQSMDARLAAIEASVEASRQRLAAIELSLSTTPQRSITDGRNTSD